MFGDRDKKGRLKLRGILFDFDGTLMDTVPLIVESYRYVYRKFSLPDKSEEEIRRGIGLPLETIFSEYPSLASELLREYILYNQERVQTHVAIFLPVLPMLLRLREAGYPLGIVTAKRYESLEGNLDAFGLKAFFEAIVSLRDTKKHKPDPTPLLCGMEKLGLADPTHVLYVGDSIHDLQAAHNGGFPAAAVRWTAMPQEDLQAEKPEIWIGDVPSFLEEITLEAKV